MRTRRSSGRPSTKARPRLEALEDRRLPAIGLAASFAGIDFNSSGGGEPPDPDVAAGPTYLVQTVNTSVAYFNKATGANVFQQNLGQFFAPAGAGPSSDMYDPTVTYDNLAGRFVVSVMEENDSTPLSYVDIAVSNDADPTHGFTEMHRVRVREDEAGKAFWADYPKIGWNADAYVYSFNMYNFPSDTGAFDHVQLLVLNKASVLDSVNATFLFTQVDRTDPADFTLAGAMTHDAAPGAPLWFVEENDAASNLRLVKMTDVLSATPTFSDFVVDVPAYTTPAAPVQPSGPAITTNIYSDILNAAMTGTELVAAQNVGVDGVTRARWYQFDVSGDSPTLAQTGDIDRGAGVDTYFPAIDVSPSGKLGMSFMESSATENMSMYVTGRDWSDSINTMEPPTLVRAGQATYKGNRAGDFSGLSVDPVTGSFWADNEFANTESTNWGTYLAKFIPNSTPITLSTLSLGPSPLTEGGDVVFSGFFIDVTAGQAHSVVIDWGDGSDEDTLTLAAGTSGFGPVSHTYADENPAGYPVVVVVNNFAGSSGAAVLSAVVHDAPLGATGAAVAASQNASFSGVVATFTDPNPQSDVGDFAATVNWGDGHSTPGTVAATGGGTYTVTGRYTYPHVGSYTVSVQVNDAGGATATTTAAATVRKQLVWATGPDAGGGPDVRVFDAYTGAMVRELLAYNPAFTGGVRVAVGDVTGDGVPDIVTSPGRGGGPDVRVFDGVTGAMVRDFMAYDPAFTGGVYVAVGDVNGDGYADVITGADAGGGPHVRVFSGKDGSSLYSFFAYNPIFSGGVRVASGDLNGDGKADIITGAGPGGGPHVEAFSGATGTLLKSFFAYSPAFSGGVYVASGDIDGDGKADIITGAGAGGGPQVEVFSGATNAVLQSFFAYTPIFTGGVRVAATADANGDGRAEIVTAAGPGGGPHVQEFNGASLGVLDSYFAYAAQFTGGVYIGGA